MAIPRKVDSDLVAWAGNFAARVLASGGAFGISEAEAAEFDALRQAFRAAYFHANAEGQKCKSRVTAKNEARRKLLECGRVLYARVQVSSPRTIADADKVLLGVTIRPVRGTRAGPPDAAPSVMVVETRGRRVTVHVSDREVRGRTRPPGAAGAYLYSAIGGEAPSDPDAWTFRGGTGRSRHEIRFPADLPPGTKVWLTAAWVNRRHQQGPHATPVSAHLAGGEPDLGAAMSRAA